MHLVQVLLPIYDNQGNKIARDEFAAVRRELTDEFGGVTLYARSPATGLWKNEQGEVDRDDVIMVEVAVDAVDAAWWATYRRDLEQRFRQDVILVRAFRIDLL
jgi:hypothetical protein